MRKILLAIVVIVLSSGQAHAWKRATHLIGVPFVAGTGVYSDVKVLQDADWAVTKAAAISNLGLMTVQASLGAFILSGKDSEATRTIHRILGISIIASGVWLSVASSLDKGVEPPARYMAYAHTGLASVPLIIFSF